METEYLDTVNKELLEIEHFFQNLYASSSLPPPYTPGILPLLKPVTAHSSSSSSFPFAESSSPHSGLGSTLGSEADVPEVDMDHLAADLRARYKQLKVVQDRLHIELTKLYVWKHQQQSKQTRQTNQQQQQQTNNERICHEQQSPPALLASSSSTSTTKSTLSSNDAVSRNDLPQGQPSSFSSSSSSSSSSCGVTTRSPGTRWGSIIAWIAVPLLGVLAAAAFLYLEMPEHRSPPPRVHRDCPRSYHHDSYPWPRL